MVSKIYFFFQAEDGILGVERSRGLGSLYTTRLFYAPNAPMKLYASFSPPLPFLPSPSSVRVSKMQPCPCRFRYHQLLLSRTLQNQVQAQTFSRGLDDGFTQLVQFSAADTNLPAILQTIATERNVRFFFPSFGLPSNSIPESHNWFLKILNVTSGE